MTASARADNAGGTSMPRTFAVLRLITNSNLVGCNKGKSAGLALSEFALYKRRLGETNLECLSHNGFRSLTPSIYRGKHMACRRKTGSARV
jgi:hypothetical protein